MVLFPNKDGNECEYTTTRFPWIFTKQRDKWSDIKFYNEICGCWSVKRSVKARPCRELRTPPDRCRWNLVHVLSLVQCGCSPDQSVANQNGINNCFCKFVKLYITLPLNKRNRYCNCNVQHRCQKKYTWQKW